MTSSPGICRRLLARKSAEYGADRQAETSEVTFRENIAGHDFSRREHILKRFPILIDDARAFVYRDSHVRERDPWPQRQPIKRRTIDRKRPIAFRRRDAARAVAIQAFHAQLRVSVRRAIVFRDGVHEGAWIEAKLWSQ